MNKTKGRKKPVIIAALAGLLLIGLLAFSTHMIENSGLTEDEQFGDTGDWSEGGGTGTEWELNFPETTYVSNDEIETYLLIGTDAGGEDLGVGTNGQLADFLTLLVIDSTTNKYGFMLIDRNTMTNVEVLDEHGESKGPELEQICIAHWYGLDDDQRNKNTVKAVSELLGGLKIDGYYTLNMADIGMINDAIGGVEVDITEDMTSLDPAFTQGAHVLLTNEQATKFVRARMNVGDGTNKGRMARQRQYMQKAYNLLMSQLRDNPEYINDLYDQLEGKIESDTAGRDMGVIANQLLQLESVGILELDGHVEVNDTLKDGLEHEEFYTDENSIASMLKKVINMNIPGEEDAEEDTDEE